MNIKSQKLDEFAQRLAGLTGEDLDTAHERAIEERLNRVEAETLQRDRAAAMRASFDRVSRLPILDSRPIDEIIGYGPDGLPS